MIIYSQFIKKSQENISLNIEGILYLKNFVKNRPPVYRGQEPMFAGPEMDEYHFLKQNLKLKDILVLESLFVNMLKELGSNIEKFEPIDDINDDEIEEHIYHMLDSSVDLEFFEQEIPDFLLSEIEGEEAKYLIDCLETMSNEIKWHEIRYNNKEEFKKVYQNIIGNFQKHIDYLEENDKLIIERTKTILKPLQQNYQNYINNSEYYEINFFDHQENNLSKLLYELLKGIVTDIIDTQENYEHEEKTLNRIIENIKSLLHPLDEYLNILTSIGNDVKGWIYTIVNDKLHNELIDYYIREHGDSLRKEAEESIYENMQEKIKENDIIPSGFGNPPENENSSWWSHIGLAEFISRQNVL